MKETEEGRSSLRKSNNTTIPSKSREEQQRKKRQIFPPTEDWRKDEAIVQSERENERITD